MAHRARKRSAELRDRLRRILDFREGLAAERQSHMSMVARAAEVLGRDPTKSKPPTREEIEAWRRTYTSAAHAAEQRCQQFDEQMIERLGTQDVLDRLDQLIGDFSGLTESEPPLVRRQNAIVDAYFALLPVASLLYKHFNEGKPWPSLDGMPQLRDEQPTPAAFARRAAHLRAIAGTDDELRLYMRHAASAIARALPSRTVVFGTIGWLPRSERTRSQASSARGRAE
jgi:hypothetical protein